MRVTRRAIEPVRKVRRVPIPPERAFALFTSQMERWWPLATHSIAGGEAAGISFEGHVGGRVLELTSAGEEHVWGEVLAWDPPHRFVISWHPRIDPVASSVLEVEFVAADAGTELRLEHRGWEEFGDTEGTELRDQYDPGWDAVLAPYERIAEATPV